jgi:hypothetical protein
MLFLCLTNKALHHEDYEGVDTNCLSLFVKIVLFCMGGFGRIE